MSSGFADLDDAFFRPSVNALTPYRPGTPVEDVQRELGLGRVIKLASNESPFGPHPAVMPLSLRRLMSAWCCEPASSTKYQSSPVPHHVLAAQFIDVRALPIVEDYAGLYGRFLREPDVGFAWAAQRWASGGGLDERIDADSAARARRRGAADGAHRRHQRLTGNEAAEGSVVQPRSGGVDPATENVDLELFKIEDLFNRHRQNPVGKPHSNRKERCGKKEEQSAVTAFLLLERW